MKTISNSFKGYSFIKSIKWSGRSTPSTGKAFGKWQISLLKLVTVWRGAGQGGGNKGDDTIALQKENNWTAENDTIGETDKPKYVHQMISIMNLLQNLNMKWKMSLNCYKICVENYAL